MVLRDLVALAVHAKPATATAVWLGGPRAACGAAHGRGQAACAGADGAQHEPDLWRAGAHVSVGARQSPDLTCGGTGPAVRPGRASSCAGRDAERALCKRAPWCACAPDRATPAGLRASAQSNAGLCAAWRLSGLCVVSVCRLVSPDHPMPTQSCMHWYCSRAHAHDTRPGAAYTSCTRRRWRRRRPASCRR